MLWLFIEFVIGRINFSALCPCLCLLILMFNISSLHPNPLHLLVSTLELIMTTRDLSWRINTPQPRGFRLCFTLSIFRVAPLVQYRDPYPPHLVTRLELRLEVLEPRVHTPLLHVSWILHVSILTEEFLSMITALASRAGAEISQSDIAPLLEEE